MLTAVPQQLKMTLPTAQQQEPSKLLNMIIKDRWEVISAIGKGAFGEVFLCRDITTKESFAIKVENPTAKKKVLKLEVSVIRKLQECHYVPRLYASGRFNLTSDTETYSFMIMQLLGPSLSELRRMRPNGKFSIPTTAMLGLQMIKALEKLHAKGILHRDIKPGNFCISGIPSSSDAEPTKSTTRPICFLIDFGLSRRYLTPSNGIREARAKIGFRGTARYASIAAHEGRDLCMVDDLWSLFYVLVEFLAGTLPWKGKEREKIGEIKKAHTNASLVFGLPHGMRQFLDYLNTMSYSSRPNYQLIYEMLNSLQGDITPGSVFYDWEEKCGSVEQDSDKSSKPDLVADHSEEAKSDVVMAEAESEEQPLRQKPRLWESPTNDDRMFDFTPPGAEPTQLLYEKQNSVSTATCGTSISRSGIFMPTPPASASPRFINLRSRKYFRV